MIISYLESPQLPKDQNKSCSLPIHIDGILFLNSCALQLIAVLHVYNSILRLSGSCISVPPCIVVFALLFAVSFTLVFVKVHVWKQEFFQFLWKSYCTTQDKFKWSIECLLCSFSVSCGFACKISS